MDVVSGEQMANKKLEDTRLKLKEDRQKFSQTDATIRYQELRVVKTESELQDMAFHRTTDILAAKEEAKAELVESSEKEMAILIFIVG